MSSIFCVHCCVYNFIVPSNSVCSQLHIHLYKRRIQQYKLLAFFILLADKYTYKYTYPLIKIFYYALTLNYRRNS